MSDINVSASYFIRSIDDVAALALLEGHSVQIYLNPAEQKIVDAVKRAVNESEIKVQSIHLPKLAPEHTREATRYLKDVFGTKSFTIHPENGSIQQFEYAWRETLKQLKADDIRIGFENSTNSKSPLRNPYNLPKNGLFYLTLDVQHLPETLDEVTVFEELKDRILSVHLVSRQATAPYDGFNRLLPQILENPTIEYVLEYGKDHITQMKQDYKTIRQSYAALSLSETASKKPSR